MKQPRIQAISVAKIRPEDGLGRKRDREGHRELCQSIEQFGVLTPVTVRVAPDGSGDYLLIKGQGRTLACRLLGIERIPAIVVDDEFGEYEKVQQFLVENVARLRMRPIDRAVLIARARQDGEETASVAKRFGVTPATVRRLESQLEGASNREVAALQDGNLNLALHAVIARYMGPDERSDAVSAIAGFKLKTRELEVLFEALGWKDLVHLGPEHSLARLKLLAWACATLHRLPAGSIEARLGQLGAELPIEFGGPTPRRAVAS
ncbi:ParB/RepB/Spo0J family partition protein [Micromonospora sp. SCSIO 07396]